MNTTKTLDEIVWQVLNDFNGQTFSNHEESIAWLGRRFVKAMTEHSAAETKRADENKRMWDGCSNRRILAEQERDIFRAKAEIYDLIEKFGFEKIRHVYTCRPLIQCTCGLDEILAKVAEIREGK